MWWALGVVVVVAVGLPLTIGLATRGLGRRPMRPLRPGYGKTGEWLHEHYGLDWRACVRVEQAVGRGERVGDPALEDAAHGLAGLIISGRAPGQQLARRAGVGFAALGLAALVTGIVTLSRGRSHESFLVFYGPLWMIQGVVQGVWVPRVHRRKAARALELNRQAAARRLARRDGQPGVIADGSTARRRPAGNSRCVR